VVVIVSKFWITNTYTVLLCLNRTQAANH